MVGIRPSYRLDIRPATACPNGTLLWVYHQGLVGQITRSGGSGTMRPYNLGGSGALRAVRQGELAMNTSDASSNRAIRREPQARIRVVADDAADHVARRGALVRGTNGWRP
jgi:hypothetical protein